MLELRPTGLARAKVVPFLWAWDAAVTAPDGPVFHLANDSDLELMGIGAKVREAGYAPVMMQKMEADSQLSVQPGVPRIGWIGTGVMGCSMAGHLLRAGYPCSLFTRTLSKAASLVESGAVLKNSPAAVAADADVVFTMVGFPEDVQSVYFGDSGILKTARPGTIVVDMTTSRPELAVRIHQRSALQGVHAIDAPVSGGDSGAANATLSIMVGGDVRPVQAIDPLLRCLGKTIVHQGGPGRGQHTKMVNQILVATNMIGICESLLYAFRAGLDVEKVLLNVASGAAGSAALSALWPRILAGDFEPGFYVEHFIKDMGIALDEAAAMNLSLPGLALARQLYVAVAAQGLGRKGTQALVLALADLSKVDLKLA